MRFLSFSAFVLGLALLAPSLGVARVHHLPAIRHQPHYAQQQPANKSAPADIREVRNDFFSITLPEGWKLQKPVYPAPDRVSAVFMKGSGVRVALNIFSTPFTAKVMAEKTAENMRKRGMEVSQPVEKDGFYVVDIAKNGVTGKGWFANRGSTGASTILFAPDLSEANELLLALKPAVSGIVPQKAE